MKPLVPVVRGPLRAEKDQFLVVRQREMLACCVLVNRLVALSIYPVGNDFDSFVAKERACPCARGHPTAWSYNRQIQVAPGLLLSQPNPPRQIVLSCRAEDRACTA